MPLKIATFEVDTLWPSLHVMCRYSLWHGGSVSLEITHFWGWYLLTHAMFGKGEWVFLKWKFIDKSFMKRVVDVFGNWFTYFAGDCFVDRQNCCCLHWVSFVLHSSWLEENFTAKKKKKKTTLQEFKYENGVKPHMIKCLFLTFKCK